MERDLFDVGGLPDATDALSNILAGGNCLSFVLCQRVRAFALGHYLFAKLGANFGIYATSCTFNDSTYGSRLSVRERVLLLAVCRFPFVVVSVCGWGAEEEWKEAEEGRRLRPASGSGGCHRLRSC